MATHIPYCGRHGLLVSMKNDDPHCLRMFDQSNGHEDRAEYKDYYTFYACDSNFTCNCTPGVYGVVWSEVMSSLPADAEETWKMYLPELSDEYAADEEEDAEYWLRHERAQRAKIMDGPYVSMASGESYVM